MAEAKKTTTSTRKTSTTTTAAKKKAPTKRAPRSAAAKTTIEKVEANAKHIEENSKTIENNSKLIHILYGAIIFLMMIIAGLAFYLGQTQGNKTNVAPVAVAPVVPTAENVTITIIDDERCTDCPTDSVVRTLKSFPFLIWANYIEQDFSEDGVAEYLKDNEVTRLPAVIFNTDELNDAGQLAPFIRELPNGSFTLELESTFDPFASRSEAGFLTISDEIISEIQETAHYNWNPESEITWIEYTDVNCHYCKKMESDGTANEVLAKFPEINKTSSNFIWVGWVASQTAAEALECVASVGGSEVYNSILSSILLSGNNSETEILKLAGEASVDTESVSLCIENGDSQELVASKFAIGTDVFGVTGTPGNIILNNTTGEYQLVSGACGASTFEKAIDYHLEGRYYDVVNCEVIEK